MSGKLSGVRKSLHDALLPFVEQGSKDLASIQKGHTKWKIDLMEFISLIGSHEFYVICFPILYLGWGDLYIGRQLLLVLSTGIWFGNWFKDYLCLPRPLPPAQKLSPKYHDEYGFPSTHSVCGLAIPFYFIFTFLEFNTWQFYVASLFGLSFVCLVSYSRMYLGMHTLPDIIGGLAVAVVVLTFWFNFGFELVEDWILTGSYVPFWSVVIGAFLLTMQPESVGHCVCFDDSVCFIGSIVGGMCGAARLPFFSNTVDNSSLFWCIFRYVFGVSLMVGSRFVFKPLVRAIVPKLLLYIEGPKRNIDVNSVCRFIVYWWMVWCGTEFIPRLLVELNLFF